MRALLTPLLLVALSACGGSAAVDETPREASEATFLAADLNFPLQAPTPGGFGIVRAFPKLTFSRPMLLTHAGDDSDRVFVVEKAGSIRVFPNEDAVEAAAVKTFLDIRSAVSSTSNEAGLLGMAFDPEYRENGYFYLNYNRSGPFRTVIARYQVDPLDPNRADPSSRVELLTFGQPFSNHNGGMIAFGSDGMLYIATGDGGSGGDPFNNSQNLGNLLGKILRIDPHQTNGSLIPDDNPFVDDPSARGEIWAYGLRNPWRFSFDRNSGALWCGDVGQGRREEIDIITKQGNYGWRVYEGNRSNSNPLGLPPSQFEAPVIEYDRALGTAVIGGYVYRGPSLPGLRGTYLYADNGHGRIWGLVYKDGEVVSNQQIAALSRVTSFGEDQAGEVHVLSDNGSIWRMAALQPSGGSFPEKLSETGLFSDLETLTPAPGVLPYEVNSALWSDGAGKQRWIALPAANSIQTTAQGSWQFPVGTVLVKHFALATNRDGLREQRRLETRVFVHEELAWAGYTYKWLADASDAVLINESKSETYRISGNSRQGRSRPATNEGQESDPQAKTQTWTYPSRPDCMACHSPTSGSVLGFRSLQINDPIGSDQLAAFAGREFFANAIGNSFQYPTMPNPRNPRAGLEDRARAYLDANCANCHHPNGPAPTEIDLRYQTDLSLTGLVDVRPLTDDLGLADPWLIRPGEPEKSVLWLRMQRRDSLGMPRIGSHLLDVDAIDLLRRWIETLN